MSNSCQSIATGHRFATAFFGGAHRGKVVQIHMTPDVIELATCLTVEDETSGVVETFADWLRGECANARMILFDGGVADPKVPSILVL